MTEQPHSGPNGPWSGSDEHLSEFSNSHSEDFAQREEVLADSDSNFQSDNHTDARHESEPGPDPTSPLDAPAFDDASNAAGSRRSRGRGGRRSRGAGPASDTTSGAAPEGAEHSAPRERPSAALERPSAPLERQGAGDDRRDSGGFDDGAATDGTPRRRRRTRGGRGRKRPTGEPLGSAALDLEALPLEVDVDSVEDLAFDDDDFVRTSDIQDGASGAADDQGSDEGVGRNGFSSGRGESELDGDGPKRRRRGSRGGRRRKKTGVGNAEVAAPRSASTGRRNVKSKPAPRSARPGQKDRSARDESSALWVDAIPGEEDDFAALPGDDHRHASMAPRRRGRASKKEVEVEDRGSIRKSSRKRRAKRGEDDDEVDADTARQQAQVERDQLILVNAVDPEETRVVVEQDGRIVDLVMTVNQHKSYVNDIYRGRVVNIEDAIGAAFVDFGQGRNGFLHASDVMHIYGDEDWRLDKLLTAQTDADDWHDDARAPTESLEEGVSKRKSASSNKAGRTRPRGRKRMAITELLKRGQLVVAQITKDAIGDKGPTLTTYISIPGRYLVLMPSLEKTGVSRKIEDDRERRRLKRILTALDIPPGMGVIVRTAGIGKSKDEIRRDLDYLLAVWESFSKNLILGRNPAPLYQESAVSIRTMRDLFSSRTKAVIVDDESVYHEMREFTEKLMPEHLDRIKLHDGQRPLFHSHGIEPDFEKLFSRRVELPSGGSIVFDQTEALVAIDVNSGRTRDEGADFEDIALKANLEAVPEIARQIKLRDLGGIIVVDFIDMMRPASRRKVEKAFCSLLDEDRARNKVGRISQFGLLELTRQRLGPGLSKLLYEPCAYCRGTGRRRTAQSKAQAVLRRLGSALTQKGFTKIEIIVHPDTLDWLKKHDWKEVMELEQKSARELAFVGAEDQHEDSVFHYLRADGREVRPGGRRRR